MYYVRLLCATAISLVLFTAGVARANSAPILPAPEKLSERVYAWIGPLQGPNKSNQGYRMNLMFVVGNESVAVIDTGYTIAMAKEMLAHIRKITDKPIKYAINGNSQPHRFMGNAVFKQAGAELITHAKEYARMSRLAGQFTNQVENALGLPKNSVALPELPDSLLSEPRKINLGGVTLQLDSPGQSHTPSSLTVHVLEDDIVYAGDILYSGRLLSVLPDSSVRAWLRTYDKLKDFGDVTFVPGHGAPAKLTAFDWSTRSYLQLLNSHMSKQVNEGTDMDAAIKLLDQAAYEKLENYDMLAGRNASWAYLEAEKASFE